MRSDSARRERAVPFARQLLSHRRSRTAVASAGIAFATLVLFMQIGFYSSVVNTALAVSSRLDADLLMISPRYVHVADTETIPRNRGYQAFGMPEVEGAFPAFIRYAELRNEANGERCRMVAIGIALSEAADFLPLAIPEVTEQLASLEATGTVLADRLTQPDCGVALGSETQVEDRAAQIAGQYDLGVGFLGDGSLVMSDDSFTSFFTRQRLDEPQFILLRLREGSDPETVARGLGEILPNDVVIVTREQLEFMQLRHWVENTAVGNMFTMGALAGFFVGLAVLYQILSIDVRNALPLYATLKAMGYGNRKLQGYVVQQSWMFALLGFAPALAIAATLFPIIHRLTLLPIYMTPTLAFGVLGLSAAMCTAAGILSARRLRSADPAELF